MAFLVNVGRQEAETALVHGQDARAVRPDELRLAVFQIMTHLHHVEHRNVLGDAADEVHASVRRLHDGVRREPRRNVNDRDVRACLTGGVRNGIEHGDRVQHGLPRPARRDAGHDVRAVFLHDIRMKRRLLAGDALHDDAAVFSNKNSHIVCLPHIEIA